MVFNRPPEQIGHWKDELPFLKVDLARLEEIDRVFVASCENPEHVLKWKIELPRGKMAMKWKEEHGVLTRWADTTPARDEAAGDLERMPSRIRGSRIKNLLTEFRYAKILHAPLRRAAAG